MKTVAIDIDDSLNNFTETLRATHFSHDPSSMIPPEAFGKYLEMLRSGKSEEDDLLSTEFTYFRHKIYSECFPESSNKLDQTGNRAPRLQVSWGDTYRRDTIRIRRKKLVGESTQIQILECPARENG